MRNKFIILVIALIVVVVGVGIYLAVRNALQNGGSGGTQGTGGNLSPVVTSTLPDQASTSTTSYPTGSTFQIGTGQGVVMVKNFYNTDAYITADQQTVVLVQNDDYNIVYNRGDSGFIIVFRTVSGSLQKEQAAAEADFLAQLGVSNADACKLNVDEHVIDKTSADYGDAMGLSFCTGSPAQ
jgi:hypothetical protein